MGPGLLAIWNGIVPEQEAQFNEWYDGEHIPERLAQPGFVAARRYRDAAVPHRYCALYDTDSPAALSSPQYMARLADPTPATRAIMAHFRDMSRAVCEVVLDTGTLASPGRALALLEIGDRAVDVTMRDQATALAAAQGLRIRVAAPDAGPSQVQTPEQRLRRTPDRLPSTLLLVEGEDAASCLKAAAALAPGRPAMTFELLYARYAGRD